MSISTRALQPVQTFSMSTPSRFRLLSVATPYMIGSIQLRGLITNPVASTDTSSDSPWFSKSRMLPARQSFHRRQLSNAIGIGTVNPLATLDVRGMTGTTPIASLSGVTSFASLVVDQSGFGDILYCLGQRCHQTGVGQKRQLAISRRTILGHRYADQYHA